MITGNHHAAAADLVAMSGLERGQSVLTVSLRRVRENLLRHPWVLSVSLERRLPHSMTIRVEEREEVAWMTGPSGDGCLVIGEGGVVVSKDCARATSLIELRGARLSGVGVGSTLLEPAVVALIDAVRVGELVSLRVRCVDLADPDSIALETESGLRVLLGGLGEIRSRLDSLAALSRSLNVEDYEVIDLRFGGEATLVPR